MSTNIFNSTRPVSTNKMNQTKPFVITDAQAPQAQQNQQQGQKSSVIGPLFFDFKTMSFQPMFDFNKPLVDQQNQWINLQKQKPAQTEEQQPAAANQTVKAQALQPKPEQQQKADLFPEAQGDTAVNSAAAPAGQKDTTDYSQAALEQKMKEQGVVAPQRQYTNQDWDNFRKSRFGQRDDVTVDDDPDTAINMYKSLGVLTDKEKDPPEMVQTAKSKPQDVTYVHPDYREEATKQMFDNYEADKKNVGRLRKLYDTTVDLDQQMLEKRNEAFHEVYDNKDPLAKKNAEHGSWWNPTGILTGLGSALFSKKVYNPETQTYENKAPSDWHELTQNLVRNVATLGSGVHIGRRGRQYTAGYDPTMPMSLLRQQRADAYAPYAEREALRSQLAQDAIRPTTKPWQLDQPYPGVSHPMEGYARAQIDTEMGFRAIQETMKRIQQLRGWTPDSQEYIELENQLLGLTPSILQKARWYVDGLRKTNQFSDQELNRAYVDFLMKEYTGQSLTEQEQAVEAARAKATSDALKSQMEWEDHQSKMATEEANRQLTFAKTQEKVWPLLNKAQGKQLDVNEVQANLPHLFADAQEAIAEGNAAKASAALKRFEAFHEGVKGVKLPLKDEDWKEIAETERTLAAIAGGEKGKSDYLDSLGKGALTDAAKRNRESTSARKADREKIVKRRDLEEAAFQGDVNYYDTYNNTSLWPKVGNSIAEGLVDYNNPLFAGGKLLVNSIYDSGRLIVGAKKAKDLLGSVPRSSGKFTSYDAVQYAKRAIGDKPTARGELFKSVMPLVYQAAKESEAKNKSSITLDDFRALVYAEIKKHDFGDLFMPKRFERLRTIYGSPRHNDAALNEAIIRVMYDEYQSQKK